MSFSLLLLRKKIVLRTDDVSSPFPPLLWFHEKTKEKNAVKIRFRAKSLKMYLHVLIFLIDLFYRIMATIVFIVLQFSSVQSLSCVWLFVTHQASLSITNSWSSPKPMSIESVMPSNHLILCIPFSSCPQSFPASGSFPDRQLFVSGVQSIGTSASASVFKMNIQGWFPLGLTDLIILLSKGLSRVFSSPTTGKYQFFDAQPSHGLTLTSVHDYWRNHSFDCIDLGLPWWLRW